MSPVSCELEATLAMNVDKMSPRTEDSGESSRIPGDPTAADEPTDVKHLRPSTLNQVHPLAGYAWVCVCPMHIVECKASN